MKLIKFIYISLLCIIATACSDDNPPSSVASFTDVALIKDINESGTTFAIAGNENNIPTRLHSSNILHSEDTELKGTCIVISYTFADESTGEINLRGASIISNFNAISDEKQNIEGWNTDIIRLMSYWTIERRIILRVQLPYSPDKRRLELVVNNTTLSHQYPEAFLFHSLEGTIDPADTFYRTYYIAFNIDEISESIDWKGLKIHINDPELKSNPITIEF